MSEKRMNLFVIEADSEVQFHQFIKAFCRAEVSKPPYLNFIPRGHDYLKNFLVCDSQNSGFFSMKLSHFDNVFRISTNSHSWFLKKNLSHVTSSKNFHFIFSVSTLFLSTWLKHTSSFHLYSWNFYFFPWITKFKKCFPLFLWPQCSSVALWLLRSINGLLGSLTLCQSDRHVLE